MLALPLGCLLFGGLVSAATLPATFARSNNPMNITTLTADDIIVWGKNGRMEVWPKAKYEYLSSLESSAFELTALAPLNATSFPSTGNSTVNTKSKSKSRSTSKREENSKLETRGCKSQNIIVENADQTFLNWDVPMTSVVHATGVTNVIQISTGYSIANSIGVSAAAKITLVEDFLETTYTISYTETWTTTTTSAYSFYVEPGNYAAIVSNPRTTRKTGTVYEGCIGDASSVTTYQADSYTSQSWGDLAWVSGTISLCNGTTYPLPACVGNGLLY